MQFYQFIIDKFKIVGIAKNNSKFKTPNCGGLQLQAAVSRST